MWKKYLPHLLIIVAVLTPLALLRYAWYQSAVKNYQLAGQQGMPSPPGGGGTPGMPGGSSGGGTDPNQYGPNNSNPTQGLESVGSGLWKNTAGTLYVWSPGTPESTTLTLDPSKQTAVFALLSPNINLRSLLPFFYATADGGSESVAKFNPLNLANPLILKVTAPDGITYTVTNVTIWDDRNKRLASSDTTGSALHTWLRYVPINLSFTVGNDPSVINSNTGATFSDAIENVNDPNRCDAGYTPLSLIQAGVLAIPRDVQISYHLSSSVHANDLRDGKTVGQVLVENPIVAEKMQTCTEAVLASLRQPSVAQQPPTPAPLETKSATKKEEKSPQREEKGKNVFSVPEKILREFAKPINRLVNFVTGLIKKPQRRTIGANSMEDTTVGVMKGVLVNGTIPVVFARIEPSQLQNLGITSVSNVRVVANGDASVVFAVSKTDGSNLAIVGTNEGLINVTDRRYAFVRSIVVLLENGFPMRLANFLQRIGTGVTDPVAGISENLLDSEKLAERKRYKPPSTIAITPLNSSLTVVTVADNGDLVGMKTCSGRNFNSAKLDFENC